MSKQKHHRVATADGTTLGVIELPGVGNPLVALHGFTGNAETMLPLVERVRGERPAWLVDIVGHGNSDAPDVLEPYMMNSVVDQVLSVVGQRPPASVHLLGYSMGGRIALSIASRAPWYFASITTLSASPGLEDPIERAARHEADEERALRIERDGVAAFCEWWLSLPLFAPMVASLTEDELNASLAQRQDTTPTGLAHSLRGTGTGSMPPLWAALRSVRSPLLALAGTLDDPYLRIAERMADAAPFGQWGAVPDAGHALHVENPDEVSRLLRQFLEGCDTGAP